jgi:peptide/nickel transport system substrate-binding protein
MSPGLVESPAVFDSADIETNPVGSGPYILNVDESVTGSNYVYTRNPDYWDPESVHYDNLVIRVLTDPTAVLNAVRAGEIDGGNLLDNAAIGDVEAVGYTVNPLELDWEGLLLLDRDGALAPELADVRVRQAINYAFDREGLLKAFSDGNGTVTTQIFPPTSVGYDTALDEAYSYDPEKARELLSEAGYPDGFTLEMPSVTSYSAANWALIAQQLSEVGITVNYTDATTTFIADVLGTKYPVTWLRLQQDQDWGLIRFELTPDAIFNPFHTTDPQLSALIEQVRTTTGAENEEAVSAVNEFVVDQAWFAPWFRPQTSFVTKPGTTVQVQTGNAYPYLWNIKPE